MGILRETLQKLRNRKLQNQNIGVNYLGREMTYAASLIIFQAGDEIHLGKNRINGLTGFIKLSEVLDFIIKEYMRSDLTDELTPSASWNVPIKEELDIVIREVLKKHGVLKEK